MLHALKDAALLKETIFLHLFVVALGNEDWCFQIHVPILLFLVQIVLVSLFIINRWFLLLRITLIRISLPNEKVVGLVLLLCQEHLFIVAGLFKVVEDLSIQVTNYVVRGFYRRLLSIKKVVNKCCPSIILLQR